MAIVGRAKYTRPRRSLRVASPRTFARVRVYFARPTITIAKIRDYSQSKLALTQAIIGFFGCKRSTGDTRVIGNESFDWAWMSPWVSSVCLDVLDTTVFKGERFNKQTILDIRTHFKPTETSQYTHFSSCHPPGVRKGFIKGEALRLFRTNSSAKSFVRDTTPTV